MDKNKPGKAGVWVKVGSRFKCMLQNRNGEQCGKEYASKHSLECHRFVDHKCSLEKKSLIIKKSNQNALTRKAKTNQTTDMHLRINDGIQLFEPEKKLNKKSEAYKHLVQFFKIEKPVRRLELCYGTIFYLYKLKRNNPSTNFEDVLEAEKNNSAFVVKVHISTSFGSKLCRSVKKGGKSQLVKLLGNLGMRYTCYKTTFSFKVGSSKENRHAGYLWEKWWKQVAIFKNYFKTQFKDEKAMSYEFLGTNDQGKAGFDGELSKKDFDLAFEIAQTLRPLYPIPLHLIPNGSVNSGLEHYVL